MKFSNCRKKAAILICGCLALISCAAFAQETAVGLPLSCPEPAIARVLPPAPDRSADPLVIYARQLDASNASQGKLDGDVEIFRADQHLATEHILFDPNTESIDEERYMKAFIGYAMVLAGEEEQGRHVIELASTRNAKIRAAFEDPQRFNDFALAAISGDRESASDALKYLSTDYRATNIYSSRMRQNDPWLAEYQMDPNYQAMLANWERHATEQRELLLEIYDGTYPMPENF
jgi:hypothetical protein